MVHAGIPPQWDIHQALAYSREVEAVLQSHYAQDFLANMYGNSPKRWKNKLIGHDRMRMITNYFTRMRFCTRDGELELQTKESAAAAPLGYAPWFSFAERKTQGYKLVFGHWAALEGQTGVANVYALDTGCVWGGALTALRLEDERYFSCFYAFNSPAHIFVLFFICWF
jgi:bis(5'-nucleosyl)-tetraphosphatase (symmetrical)